MNRGITALTLLALAGTAHAQAPGTAPYVQVGTVTKGKDAVARRSIGHTEAIRYVTVTSAVEGHLQKPQFKEGSIVRKGDILFEIEPIRYKAAVQKAQATVDEIEAKLAYAEANYQRKSKLGADRLTSAENLDTAKAQLEELKAQKAEAEAELATAEKNLADCTIRAEITGRIGRLNYSEGHYIKPGEEICSIRQMDPIYVRFPLSQSDVNGIFGGSRNISKVTTVKLKLASGQNYPHNGRIRVVDNALSSKTDSYSLWAEFDNKDHILTPIGLGALTVSLSDTETVAMVPMTAVRYDNKGSFVYIVNADNTVERRDVIAGTVQGSQQSIYKGLEEGETVITDGSHKTRVGAKVTPVMRKNTAATPTSAGAADAETITCKANTVIKESDTTELICNGAQVESINKVDVLPLVTGLLIEQKVKDGKMVKQGDVIFRIDPTRYQAAVDAQKARIAQLTIQIEDARKKLERQKYLVERGASSQDELDSAQATYRQLCAQKSGAQAQLVINEDDLNRCDVRATINSRIGRVQQAQGNYFADTRQSITTLYQMSPIYVRFFLSENDVLSHFGSDEHLLAHSDITLVTANGEEYPEQGEVSFGDNHIKSTTNTQNFWATFPNAERTLHPGATVTIRLTRKPECKVCSVPAEAILTDTSGRYVYTCRDGKAVETRVLCGKSTASGRIPIYSGLNEGDQVLTTNLADLSDGCPVTIEQ